MFLAVTIVSVRGALLRSMFHSLDLLLSRAYLRSSPKVFHEGVMEMLNGASSHLRDLREK
jgi:hypothetical protein